MHLTKTQNSGKKYFVDYDMQTVIWTGFSFYLLLARFLSHQCVTQISCLRVEDVCYCTQVCVHCSAAMSCISGKC